MPTTLRRDVISSSAVAAGFRLLWPEVCSGRAARMPSQHKPIAPVRRAKTPDRYKVGDAKITTPYHGIWEKVHDAQVRRQCDCRGDKTSPG
jgi:hypothetical protein